MIVRSGGELEYMTMANTTYELVWLCFLLIELRVPCHMSMHLACDNQVAIHNANNLVFYNRTKHIDLD